MPSNLEEPRDDKETQLWHASQNYMHGKITAEQLEEVERPNADDLKKALVGFSFGRRRSGNKEPATRISRDDRERYLWVMSKRYMAEDLTVEQLEEIEIHHTKRFDKALTGLAAWNLKRSLLDFLRLR